MKLLKMKEQTSNSVHVPGLGLFKKDEWTEVSDDDVDAYNAQTRQVVTHEEFTDRGGNLTTKTVTTEETLKVEDRFDIKNAPVEKKDTAAKKADNGGDKE